MRRRVAYGFVLVSATLMVGCAAKRMLPHRRLTVAVLWFENETDDPQVAHWRYTIHRLLMTSLREVKSVSLCGGARFTTRQLKRHKGAALDASHAQKMGELIGAQYVVWGTYRRDDETWYVTASVLYVTSGKVLTELSVASTDWFEVRDWLVGQILNELNVTPSDVERQRVTWRPTTSPVALERMGKVNALEDEQKPFSDVADEARKATESDPQFVEAHVALALALGRQGKFAEAEEAVRQALKIKPDDATANLTLGKLLISQRKPAEAEQALHKACRFAPNDPDLSISFGQLYGVLQGKWDKAMRFFEEARRLDPTDSYAHALLGLAYAHKDEPARAIAELKEAERLDSDGVSTMQMIFQAYDALGETALAVKYGEKFLTQARWLGTNPQLVHYFEERLRAIKASPTPTFINVAMPKVYTDQTLQAALQERLTQDELKMVVNPLASSPEMKRWAQQLTQVAQSDLDKAKKIFAALTRRVHSGEGGTRTAREVFAAWKKPDASFWCQEYAKLFVALARDVDVKAFYVHLEKDCRGRIVYHDCSAVFVDGKALLVDPAYRWFGVPHKEFIILDDLQTIAHHLSQHRHTREDVARCWTATKLHPDFVWGQVALVGALIDAGEWGSARYALEKAVRLAPNRWDVYYKQGIIAAHDKDFAKAEGYYRKALALNPGDPHVHYSLANTLLEQHKLKEAREEYRACLRYHPESYTLTGRASPETAEYARRMIAEIDEYIGTRNLTR